MTLREAMADAIKRHDAAQAGRVAEQLRARGWRYQQILGLARECDPWLDAGDWDDMMAEADELEAMS